MSYEVMILLVRELKMSQLLYIKAMQKIVWFDFFLFSAPLQAISKAGKLLSITETCLPPFPARSALEAQNLCSVGTQTLKESTHMSLQCFPAASFKSILDWFGGYHRANDKLNALLSSAAVLGQFAPEIVQECHPSRLIATPLKMMVKCITSWKALEEILWALFLLLFWHWRACLMY